MQSNNPFFRRYSPPRRSRNPWRPLAAILGVLALLYLIYHIPFVHNALAWRLDSLRASIVYFFRPPEEAIFVPAQVSITQPSAALTPQATHTPAGPTPTALATRPPLPPSVSLTGFRYIDQHGGWNLCGPATLAMALTYWDWAGTRNDVEDYVKPGIQDPNLNRVERGRPDKNVMPYELEDFVDTQVPGLQAVIRVGGELDTVKQLLAAGFPVVVEKGYSERDASGRISWLGHYLFVTGYDEASQEFIVQDVYLRTGDNGTGANLRSSYEEFQDQWRAFNYLFLVIYPEAQLDQVIAALGPWADEEWANQRALELAQQESASLTGLQQFFAWFNLGSSHVRLLQYVDAAHAYDYAFQLYAGLTDDDTQRPYRMMWYQTGPYWAYYYSGRHQDVISLANTTLFETIDQPTLEESLYWRGLARLAIGETGNAVSDLQEAVRLNKHFWAAIGQLEALGVNP